MTIRTLGFTAALWILLVAPARGQTIFAAPSSTVAFTVSADHATLVTRYELQIRTTDLAGVPVFARDLGKPIPSTTPCVQVGIGTVAAPCVVVPVGWTAAQFTALPVANYVVVIVAIGTDGATDSAPSRPFTVPSEGGVRPRATGPPVLK